MITKSARDEFLGVHVTVGVKEALRIEADKKMISMSKLVYDLLRRDLRDLGYNLTTGKKLPRGERDTSE
jgi:hypothetical protein